MKTKGYISIISGLLLMASCSSNHRMVTHIYPDGQIDREVYAHGDSAFMATAHTLLSCSPSRTGNRFL